LFRKEKKMAIEKEYKLNLQYGMGGACVATLPETEVEGSTARDLINSIVKIPQPNKPAQRTARVLVEVIASGRSVDVELSDGKSETVEPGKPIELDDVVVQNNMHDTKPKEITFKVSEPYVGGLQFIKVCK
jgi:hypothetical protein